MRFSYDEFTLDKPNEHILHAMYKYTVGRERFHSTVTWSLGSADPLLSPTVRQLAALLGFVEGLSYWKSSFADTFEILVPDFSGQAQDWCRELIVNGMAECAYRNDLLSALAEVDLRFAEEAPQAAPERVGSTASDRPAASRPGRELLLYSGGKDSLATRLALGAAGSRASAELVHYEWAWSDADAAPSGADGSQFGVVISRLLDARLRDANTRGGVNGHVPFSAYIGLAAVVAAEAIGGATVLAGNTRSDDEPNVTVGDRQINHQWSKSMEFEQSFQDLLQGISAGSWYECPLRPFYELQVIAYLLGERVDLGHLRTCNRVREGWCGECAKCLWVYMAVAALTDGPSALATLGFAPEVSAETLPTIRAMAGMDGVERPFECTGTSVEVRSVLGRVYQWLLPASDVRTAAQAWAGQLPTEKLLRETGPRALGARYNTELLTR